MSSKKKNIYSQQKSFQEEYNELSILSNGSHSLQSIQQTLDASEQFLQENVIQTYKNAQQTYQTLMRQITEAEQLRAEIQQPLQVCADIIERYLIIKSNTILMIIYIIDKINETLGSGFSMDQANNAKLLSSHDIEGELFYLNKLCSVIVRLYLHIKQFHCANDLMVIKRNIRAEQFQDTVYIKRFYKEPQMQMEFTGDGLFDTIGRFAVLCYTNNLNIDRQNRLNVFDGTDLEKISQRANCLLALGTCLLCQYAQQNEGLVLVVMASQFLSEIDVEKATAKGVTTQAPGILNKGLHFDPTYIIDLTKDRSTIYDVFSNHILRCSQAKNANSKYAKKV